MVTVVAVTHDSAHLIAGFVAALPAAFEGAGAWRLVFCDNASSDGTLATIARHAPDATVIPMGANRGYAAGINAAAEMAAGEDDALLAINPDVCLRPGSVGHLLAALRQPGVGVAAPRLLDLEGRLLHSLRRDPTVLRAFGEAFLGAHASRFGALGETVGDARHYLTTREVDWATGAVLLISRACLDQVGSWDDSFFLYSEETDFILRARDAGWSTLFVPAAVAAHANRESAPSPKLWALLTVNRRRLFRRRHGPLASAVFALALLLHEASRVAAGRRLNREALAALLFPSRVPFGVRP